MSAGISNLGMGYEPQRYDSAPILGADYYAQQAAAQQQALAQQAAQQQATYQQQLAGIQRPQDPTDYLNSLIQQQAQRYTEKYAQPDPASGYVPDGTLTNDFWVNSLTQNVTPYAMNGKLNQISLLDPDLAQQFQSYYGNRNPSMGAGYGQDGAYQQQQAAANAQAQAISQQQQAAAQAAAKAQAEAAAKAQAEEAARQNNQATQQQAYNQQTGGGFSGGILNSSYAQPFGNTITGTANTGGFNGGMMGAPSTAAASTGLNPTGPAAGMLGTGFGAATGQQPGASAWGGPFSNKNPWSLG